VFIYKIRIFDAMIEEQENRTNEQLTAAVVSAMNDLPILSRLEFAKNMVLENGGNRHNVGHDPVLVLVNDILADVIQVIKRHPVAAQLRAPEP
jgi:hypothetical protein